MNNYVVTQQELNAKLLIGSLLLCMYSTYHKVPVASLALSRLLPDSVSMMRTLTQDLPVFSSVEDVWACTCVVPVEGEGGR